MGILGSEFDLADFNRLTLSTCKDHQDYLDIQYYNCPNPLS